MSPSSYYLSLESFLRTDNLVICSALVIGKSEYCLLIMTVYMDAVELSLIQRNYYFLYGTRHMK